MSRAPGPGVCLLSAARARGESSAERERLVSDLTPGETHCGQWSETQQGDRHTSGETRSLTLCHIAVTHYSSQHTATQSPDITTKSHVSPTQPSPASVTASTQPRKPARAGRGAGLIQSEAGVSWLWPMGGSVCAQLWAVCSQPIGLNPMMAPVWRSEPESARVSDKTGAGVWPQPTPQSETHESQNSPGLFCQTRISASHFPEAGEI